MAVWLVRGGRGGERERRMLDEGMVSVGWQELPDLSTCPDRDTLETEYRKVYPESNDLRVSKHLEQIEGFAQQASEGDLIVMPLKSRSAIAVGELSGPYAYAAEGGPDRRHTRQVKWLRADIPKSECNGEFLSAFEAFVTFGPVDVAEAEPQLRQLVETAPKAPPAPAPAPAPLAPRRTRPAGGGASLERNARTQIIDFIGRRFRGREIARLLEDLLRVQGYCVWRAPGGNDSEVDLLANAGPSGAGRPSICVRVVISGLEATHDTLAGLREKVESTGAEHGFLMSWGGFEDAVVDEAQAAFPKLGLWEAGEVADSLMARYDDLPNELRAEIPLKRVWALALRR